MKAFLMFPDRDFDPEQALPPNVDDLTQDLELPTLIDAMARGDEFLADICRAALLSSLTDQNEILYRQDVVRDCQANEAVIRELYNLTVESIARERKIHGWMSDRYPAAILSHAIQVLELFSQVLRTLRGIAQEHVDEFHSEGFGRFFRMLLDELDDDYFQQIQSHLRRLRLQDGVLISATLDDGGKNSGLVMRRPLKDRQTLGERLQAFTHPAPSFRIAERDEAGANALNELRGRGVNLVADALARSTDHILSFFHMLRNELAFYIGCLNLHEALVARNQPVTLPVMPDASENGFSCEGLYDASLALLTEEPVIGNDVSAEGIPLIVITGANRGGKSTFLRSVGLAQLMMQCGMYVPAARFSASIRSAVFTHFKREEDASMSSGKLDEELARMSEIADRIRPEALVLFNESFSSTNEREGSEIGRQVVNALLASHITVMFVTHQYDLAHGFARSRSVNALLLRARRDRTFKLTIGDPLPTSFGDDLYRKVFTEDSATLSWQ